MRIFTRARGEDTNKQYSITIVGLDMTINIECGTSDPDDYMRSMIKRVKQGLSETVGSIQLLPVGDTVILIITNNGLSMRKTFPMDELKYGNSSKE